MQGEHYYTPKPSGKVSSWPEVTKLPPVTSLPLLLACMVYQALASLGNSGLSAPLSPWLTHAAGVTPSLCGCCSICRVYFHQLGLCNMSGWSYSSLCDFTSVCWFGNLIVHLSQCTMHACESHCRGHHSHIQVSQFGDCTYITSPALSMKSSA